METRGYARSGRLRSREEAAMLSIFDGIHQLTAMEAAERYHRSYGLRIDAADAKRILDGLSEDGLISNTLDNGSTFTQKPGYKIRWEGMRESARLNPAEKAIGMVDSLCYSLSSDLKALAILAMDPGKKYSSSELNECVSSRLGGQVSIPQRALMNYFCRWNDAVVPVKVIPEHSIKGSVNWVSAQKEAWSQRTYDPIIIGAIRAAVGLSKEFGRTVTIAEIFGPSSSPGGHTKGASVYAIINTLANAERDHTYNGLRSEIMSRFGIDVRHEIRMLSKIGAIDYSSTYVRMGTGSSSRTSYIRKSPIDVEKAMDKVVEIKPYLSKGMRAVRSTVEIVAALEGRFEPKEVASRSGCGLDSVRKVMAAMAKMGLLAKWEGGSNEKSIVRANRVTHYMWREIFSPIGEMAWFMHTYGTGMYSRAAESVAWAGRQGESSLDGELAENVVRLVGAYIRNKKEEMGLARRD